MATTVSYKGATLTTVNNQTRTLDTAGTWVEGDFTLTDSSLDVSDTTATASDVAQGKVFYDSAGQRTTGTASGGGVGLVTLATFTAEAVRAVKIDIDPTWFDTYDFVMIVPNLTYSASDWMYVATDSQSGGSYTVGSWHGLTPKYSMILRKRENGYTIVWYRGDNGTGGITMSNITSYVYWYLYSASNTMTGTLTVYGVAL